MRIPVARAQSLPLGPRPSGRPPLRCRTGGGPRTRPNLRTKRRPAMMKLSSFSLTALTVVALVAAVAGCLRPQWAARLDVDFWSLPELHRRLGCQADEAAE